MVPWPSQAVCCQYSCSLLMPWVEAEADGGGVMLLVCGRVREQEQERERAVGDGRPEE